MIYHSEPFFVACDLAGVHDISEQKRLYESNATVYETILDKHHW